MFSVMEHPAPFFVSCFRHSDCRPALLPLDVARQAAVGFEINLNLGHVIPDARSKLNERQPGSSQIADMTQADSEMRGQFPFSEQWCGGGRRGIDWCICVVHADRRAVNKRRLGVVVFLHAAHATPGFLRLNACPTTAVNAAKKFGFRHQYALSKSPKFRLTLFAACQFMAGSLRNERVD